MNTNNTYTNVSDINNHDRIRQDLRNFLLVGGLAARGMLQNAPNWNGDISSLLNFLSLQCMSSEKKELHKTIENWKVKEYFKISADQHLSQEQADHLRAGIDWLTDLLKWIINDAFFALKKP